MMSARVCRAFSVLCLVGKNDCQRIRRLQFVKLTGSKIYYAETKQQSKTLRAYSIPYPNKLAYQGHCVTLQARELVSGDFSFFFSFCCVPKSRKRVLEQTSKDKGFEIYSCHPMGL